MHRVRAATALGLSLLLAGSLAACGKQERNDASEPSGEFPVAVTVSKFPPRQRLADTNDLELSIVNTGDQPIPQLAVTMFTGDHKADGPFNMRSDQPNLADPNRPVWVLENGYPKVIIDTTDRAKLDAEPTAGAETAQTDTYGFGSVAPGESVDAIWRVTPVKAGTYTVHYEVAAGLYGKARAVTTDGGKVGGEFVVTVTDRPPQTRVTASGRVETARP